MKYHLMRYDFVICTNAINYSIALSLLESGRLVNPWILVDTRRCDIVPVKSVRQWRLSITRWRLLNILLKIPGVFEVGRVYVPHHRLNKRANTLISRASNIDYIDDGLDTRRVTPKNFGAITVLNGSRYFTFKEYQDFPEWMKGLEIRQISSLSSIREGGEHQDNLMNGIENVFIESPGCETDEIVQMLGLSPSSVMVIRHPSVVKRKELMGDYRCVEGRDLALESILECARDKSIFFGETMSFFISVAREVHLSNRVYISASSEQLENIFGLPPLASKRTLRSTILCRVSSTESVG